MADVNFSSLPWFIRKVIIDRVIYVNPNYCLVGSEWLHSRSRQFSKLEFDYRPVSKVKTKNLITKYSEAIEFQRLGHINWKKIYERDRIQEITISYQNTEYEDLEFTEKLLKLHDLKHLTFQEDLDNFDAARILRCYVNSLRTVRITKFKTDCSMYIQDIIFTNLVSLQLVVPIDFFHNNNITKYVPNLKQFYLSFYNIKACRLLPDSVIVPNITHSSLSLDYSYGIQVQLDVSRFPDVRSLLLLGEFKLLDTKPCLKIRDVNLTGLETAFADILFPIFCNIKRLSICISNEKDDLLRLTKLMEVYPRLQYVELNIDHFDKFTEFPVGSILVNTLRIEGRIPVSLYFDWIFTSFSLERLDLAIIAMLPSKPEPTPSKNLKHIVICTHDPILKEWYKGYFSKELYPQLELLEFLPTF